MRGWNSLGIRGKVFSVMFLVLTLQVVILLCAGSYLFEWFYTNSKVSELQSSARQLRDTYIQNNADFYTRLSESENKNMLVSLIALDETGSVNVLYHSRSFTRDGTPRELINRQGDKGGEEKDLLHQQQLVEQLLEIGEEYDVKFGGWEFFGWEFFGWGQPRKKEIKNTSALTDRSAGQSETTPILAEQPDMAVPDVLSLATKLEDGIYLFLQTPRGYIKSTADLAVKYTALLSMVILLPGALAVYLLAERMAKPLRQVKNAAGRIARLDFSARCEIKGTDEVAQLGESVNEMSQELEAAVGKLVAANEVLQTDLARQQQTDHMRRQFTASVSHDFKTPLTLMISYAEALRERETPAQRQEYCDIIVAEGNRLSTMVGRMLELSKLENGVEQLEYAIFCLDELVDEVLRGQKIMCEKKQLTVSRRLESGWIVYADYQKITRVLNNLMENAVKYTPAQGAIAVGGEQTQEGYRIWVENTCEPLEESQLDRLFESFYRADTSRTLGQSYGLGLAVVKVIIDAHGKRCGAQNIPGGVRFWFELEPAALDEEDAEEE